MFIFIILIIMGSWHHLFLLANLLLYFQGFVHFYRHFLMGMMIMVHLCTCTRVVGSIT